MSRSTSHRTISNCSSHKRRSQRRLETRDEAEVWLPFIAGGRFEGKLKLNMDFIFIWWSKYQHWDIVKLGERSSADSTNIIGRISWPRLEEVFVVKGVRNFHFFQFSRRICSSWGVSHRDQTRLCSLSDRLSKFNAPPYRECWCEWSPVTVWKGTKECTAAIGALLQYVASRKLFDLVVVP